LSFHFVTALLCGSVDGPQQEQQGGGGAGASPWPLLTRERHRAVLGETRVALANALAADGDVVVAAEELRTATTLLAALTGRAVLVDDVLDVIMREFCIGK
jgi:tRNA U34 5-carboxymethylaminomethyl modifying GTPase MnmE/TrmE